MDRMIEIAEAVENGDYDAEYADFIMEHACGDRVICNGDTLLDAMEDGYLMNEFIGFLFAKGV